MSNIFQFPRKPIEQFFAEESQRISAKIKNNEYDSLMEAKLLLAIVNGNDRETRRLLDLLKRRNKSNMSVIPSSSNSKEIKVD